MDPATLTPSRAEPRAPVSDAATGGGELAVLWAVLFSSTCIVVGLIWDISWHMTIGRDTLWSPPHVLEQIGASVAGLACGALVLRTTFAGTAAARQRAVRFWGFRGPFGAWVCIWGALTMIASVPFDDWWHNAYGLDVTILSPPHTVLLSGMLAIQVGAMLLALAAQNRASGQRARAFGILYAYAAGVLVAMAAITFFEHIGYPNEWHRSGFYRLTAAVFPLFLLGVARASTLRWPATTAAGAYMAIVLAMMWILPLFPAQPLLAPIYNPVTHMVPLPFPLLLVVPALGIDLLARHMGERRDWLLAAAAAVLFVLLMVAAHWPFADLLLSPLGRNHLLGADRWPYTQTLGDWRYQFWTLDPDMGAFGRGLVAAMVAAFVSARIGLWWGGWMRRVVR